MRATKHRDHRGRDRPVGRHHDCGRRIQHLRLHPPRLVDGRPPLLRGRRRIGRAVERHQHPHVLLQRGGLEQPVLGIHLRGSNAAIDHNLYIKDGIAYQSNYRAGLRLLDVNNPTNPQEVGFIDIYPSSNSAAFNGTWSNYPYFASGVVAVSHIEEGLFLVQPNVPEPCPWRAAARTPPRATTTRPQ